MISINQNLTNSFSEFEPKITNKKQAEISINKRSIKNAQKKVIRLRPLYDEIVDKLSHISGYAGACISAGKIIVAAYSREDIRKLKSIVNDKKITFKIKECRSLYYKKNSKNSKGK